MIETGKLLEEEANTAGAKEWSFLSRNSVKVGEKWGIREKLVASAECGLVVGAGRGRLGPYPQACTASCQFRRIYWFQ